MAFGFPASYSASVELSGDRPNARETVRSIFDLLGWRYTENHADHFTATVPMSGSSWGEKVTVTLEPPGVLKIHSVCNFPQIFDWGKNKRNVDSFIERFSLREVRNAKISEEPEHFDSEGKTRLDRALIDTESESRVDPDKVKK
jgi:rhomboid protease GluP